MSGPWEDFQTSSAPASGPWEDFQQAPAQAPQASPQGSDEPGLSGWLNRTFGGARLATNDEYAKSIAPLPENAAAGAADIIKGLPSMATQLPGMAYQGAKFAVGGPEEKTQVALEALKQAVPAGVQEAQDLQQPVGSVPWYRGLGQAAMMATPALEIGGIMNAIKGERAIPNVDAVVRESMAKPEPVAPEPPPVQRVSPETGEVFHDYGDKTPPEAPPVQQNLQPEQSQVTIPSQDEFAQEVASSPTVGRDEAPPRQQPPPETGSPGVAEPQDQGLGDRSGQTAQGGVHAEALEERPIEAPEPGEGVGWEKAREYGNEWLDNGGDINRVIADFQRTQKTNWRDMGKMRAYLERLQANTNQAGDALAQSPRDPAIQQAYQQAVEGEQAFTDAYKPFHTSASNTLTSLQGRVPLTEDTVASPTGLKRAFEDAQGRPMSAQEAVRANRLSAEAGGSSAEYRQANEELYRRADTEYGRIRTSRKGAPDLGETFGKIMEEVCDT